MAKEHIEFSIGTTYNGEGFNKLNTALKSSSGNIRKASGAIINCVDSLGALDGSVGKVSRTASNFVSGFLSMGVWGVAIGAVTALVGWLSKLKSQTEDARLAAKGLSKEYMTLDAMAKGHQKLVDKWKAAKKEADEAAVKAAKAAADAEKARAAEIEHNNRFLKEQADLERQLAQVEDKRMAIGKTGVELAKANRDIAINAAQDAVDAAAQDKAVAGRSGDAERFALSSVRLRIAQANLENVIAEQSEAVKNAIETEKKLQAAKEEAARREKEAAEAKLAAEKKSQREAKAREVMEKKREDMDKKIADIDARLAVARDQASKNEEEAKKARGKSFNEWQRDEKQADRARQRQEWKDNNNRKNVEKEISALEHEQARRGKHFNPQRAARLAALQDWLNKQDPNNNPALQAAQQLEKEKAELIKKTQQDIDKIKKNLEKATI